MRKHRHKVTFIVGPTAAGKTSFAIKLAKKIKGEIISADSMQAYKGMDILSQAPTGAQRKSAPHHLVSFLDPRKEYSAAMFSDLARKKIQGIIRKGKLPVVVGGSGLYVKALADGIFPSGGKDENLRKRLKCLADKNGALFIYSKLKKIDPAAARKIHPNDQKRVIRALEIYEIEKRTKTSLKKKTSGIKDEYEIDILGITADRKKLYKRINERVEFMFRKGLVREVKRLLRHKLSITARQALGIKQVEGYLKGAYGLDQAKDMLKRDTRRFAKKQFTWFRPDKRIKWLDIERKERCS